MKCVFAHFARLRDSSGILRKQAAHRGLIITLNIASYKFYCGSDKQQEHSSRAFCEKSGVFVIFVPLARSFVRVPINLFAAWNEHKKMMHPRCSVNTFIKLTYYLMLLLSNWVRRQVRRIGRACKPFSSSSALFLQHSRAHRIFRSKRFNSSQWRFQKGIEHFDRSR